MDDCYLAALRILNYRFNSEAELRRKLERKEFPAEAIDETMNRLRDENWLDDRRFAGALVRTRQLKKIGPRRIARELNAAGVDEEIVRAVLAENADAERDDEALVALCRKRVMLLVRRKGQDYAASVEGRNKITVYLLNQGYDGALVRDVLRRVLKEI